MMQVSKILLNINPMNKSSKDGISNLLKRRNKMNLHLNELTTPTGKPLKIEGGR